MSQPTKPVQPTSAQLTAAALAVTAALGNVSVEDAIGAIRAAVDEHERPARHATRYARLAALLGAHPGLLTGGRYPQVHPAPHRTTAADVVRLVDVLHALGRVEVAPLARYCQAGHRQTHRHWVDRGRGCLICAEDAAHTDTVALLVRLLPGLTASSAGAALTTALGPRGTPRPHGARYQALTVLLNARPELLSVGRYPFITAIPVAAQAMSDLVALLDALHAAEPRHDVVPLRRLCDGGHEQARRWYPTYGCLICTAGEAFADATSTVVALVGQAAVAQVEAALRAVVTGGSTRRTPTRHRGIATHLRAHPQALVSGASDAPLDIARLIDELTGRGVTGLIAPRCADCAEPRVLRHNLSDGRRICVPCSGRRLVKEACGRCSVVRKVHGRGPDGKSICEHCWYTDPARLTRCDRCGQPARVRRRLAGLTVGSCCYLRPHERCSVCGLGRAVSPYKTGKATCAGCAEQPLTTCAHCPCDAPAPTATATATATEPLCLRCAAGTTRPCTGCGTLTVSTDRAGRGQCWRCVRRPQRTCGRCGRHSVIVRLAVDGDPELCQRCWDGPVVCCANCGRTRPCRGERSGRMLCTGCRPRPRRTCGYCGQQRSVSAVWAGGPACNQCYRHAMRAKGECPQCRTRRRLLPYLGHDEPLCAPCAGQAPGPVCHTCGNEDWLYQRGQCARCVLTRRLDTLLGNSTQRLRRGLQPLFDTLTAVDAPEGALGWLRPGQRAAELLAALGDGTLPLAHADLDVLAHAGTSANQLQQLLTSIGSLPDRDPQLGRLDYQLNAYLDTISEAEPARLLRSYVQWRLLRRARQASRTTGLSPGQRNAATAQLRAARRLLDWLGAAGLSLEGLTQPRLEDYLTAHPTQRPLLPGFLQWARQQQRITALHIVRPAEPLKVVPIQQDQRWALARHLLHDSPLPVDHRVAALLVLLFAQNASRVAAMTTASITITGDTVRLRLGQTPIDVPSPLDTLLRDLLAGRAPLGRITRLEPDNWLFPGRHPNRPADPHTIRRRLHAAGVTPLQPHRAAALIDLTGQLPAPVVADLLGITVGTAVQWGTLAGRPWGQYLGLP